MREERPLKRELGADQVRGWKHGRSLLPVLSRENEVTRPTGAAGQESLVAPTRAISLTWERMESGNLETQFFCDVAGEGQRGLGSGDDGTDHQGAVA